MQGNVNSCPRRLGVVSVKIQKRIKCCGRVRIQKCFPQSRLADCAGRQVLSFISRVTETHFPVPRLKIVAKFAHLAAQPNIEQIIVVGKLIVSGSGVVNCAKPNSGSYGKTASIGKKTWNSRIGYREGVEGILNWHTERARTKWPIGAGDLEWIGNNRHRCAGRIKK